MAIVFGLFLRLASLPLDRAASLARISSTSFTVGQRSVAPKRTPVLLARAPVVIVLSSDLVAEGHRLFPFDSGAFAANRYAKWLHEGMQLSDFELACLENAPQKYVAAFFNTNEDYLLVKPHDPPLSYRGEYEVDCFVTLLKDTDTPAADDRRLAVELQVGKQIPFDSSTVRALILPAEQLQAPFLDAYMKGPGKDIHVATYNYVPMKQLKEYQSQLEDQAKRLNESWGLT